MFSDSENAAHRYKIFITLKKNSFDTSSYASFLIDDSSKVKKKKWNEV